MATSVRKELNQMLLYPPTYEDTIAIAGRPDKRIAPMESDNLYSVDAKKLQSFTKPMHKLCGIKTKQSARELGTLILLLLLFIISLAGFFIMWCTKYYDNSITSKLIIAQNSAAAKYWAEPPVNTYLKIHVFNYTNIDRYLAREDDKIKVKDLGPFIYEEHSKKVNVKFNANHTYNDHRTYKFLPEKSSGNRFEEIIVPNVPLMSASVKVNALPLPVKFAASSAINILDFDAFLKVPIDGFIWGYPDRLMSILSTYMPNLKPKFGLLMNRNGTSSNTIQIRTGEDDIRKLGIVSQFNGMNQLNFWTDDECNRIDGSDGSQFPPYIMEARQQLFVFVQDMCRKLPLDFEEEITILDNINVWRYRSPVNVFANSAKNPANKCYCDSSSNDCLPSGVFNGTQCFQAPIYPSSPHFFGGDPVLYSQFEGIEPDEESHRTFADIHPRLAFPVNGASRIQINIAVHKGQLLQTKLQRMPEGIILPVLWIDITSGGLSDELRSLLFHSTFSVNAIQHILKFGTLLMCVISLALFVTGYYYLRRIRDKYGEVEAQDCSELVELNNKLLRVAE